jgi:MinD-like ATPase involved in chromosome partitioning or flagellar assembly
MSDVWAQAAAEPSMTPQRRQWWRRQGATTVDDILTMRHRRKIIAVGSPKGGAGKTPTSLGMASATARASRTDVVVVASGMTSSLPKRIKTSTTTASVMDVIAALDHFDQPGTRIDDLADFTHIQPDGVHVLTAHPDATVGKQITRAQFARLLRVLSACYGVVIVDTGNSYADEMDSAAYAAATSLVIPVTWSEDVVQEAVELVIHLHEIGMGHLVNTAVTVLTGKIPPDADPARVKHWRDTFKRHTAALIEVPYDRHLDAGRQIRHQRLGVKTRAAFADISRHALGAPVHRHAPVPTRPLAQMTAPSGDMTPLDDAEVMPKRVQAPPTDRVETTPVSPVAAEPARVAESVSTDAAQTSRSLITCAAVKLRGGDGKYDAQAYCDDQRTSYRAETEMDAQMAALDGLSSLAVKKAIRIPVRVVMTSGTVRDLVITREGQLASTTHEEGTASAIHEAVAMLSEDGSSVGPDVLPAVENPITVH